MFCVLKNLNACIEWESCVTGIFRKSTGGNELWSITINYMYFVKPGEHTFVLEGTLETFWHSCRELPTDVLMRQGNSQNLFEQNSLPQYVHI